MIIHFVIHTAKNTTATPDTAEGLAEGVTTMRGHGGLDDLQGLTESGDLKHVETGTQEQVRELDGLLLELLVRRGRHGAGGGGHGRVWGFKKGA